MAKPSSIENQRFNKVVVLSRVENSISGKTRWKCKCDCGTEFIASADNLKTGNTSSCGCLWRQVVAAQKITHNLSKTRTYNIWAVMKARCNNDNPNYGGRGITYDKRWGVFDAFYADMGLAPEGMSIERLNNNMGYSKTNCIWADVQTQARNKRTAQLDYFGACIILTLKKYGKSYKVIAEQLGTHISNVKDVVASRTWKDAVPLPM